MARKKKVEETPMPTPMQANPVQTAAPEELQVVTQVALKNKALGVAKDKANGWWYVVEITFDLETGAVSKPEKITSGDLDRDIIFERFRIEASNRLFTVE